VGAQGENPPGNIFARLKKCVGHSLQLLDSLNNLGRLRKLFPPLVFEVGNMPGGLTSTGETKT